MNITVGNTDGQYFTEWRFDHLRGLASMLGESIVNPHLYYDPCEDFHILTFSINGHEILVRYYKVFTVLIDGEKLCSCPQHGLSLLVQTIKNEVAIKKYVFTITHSYPADDVYNKVMDTFVSSLTVRQQAKLSAEIINMFADDGDGNDAWLGLTVTMLGPEVTSSQLLEHCRFILLNTDCDEDAVEAT